MTREKMILLLVADGLEPVESLWGSSRLPKGLEQECRGDASLPDSELVARIKARGLDSLLETNDSDLRYPDDDIELAILVRNFEERLGDR